MAIHAQKDVTLNTIPAYTSLLGGHFVYYQGDSSGTVASANVVQNPSSAPSEWGYNTHIGSNGIQLRDGLTAYTILDENGLSVFKGGVQGGAIGQINGIYLSTEDIPLRELNKTTDTTIVSGKTYYQLINKEYEVVEEPITANLNLYYELNSSKPGIKISNHTPTVAKDNNSIVSIDGAWRQVVGDKFGVDAKGNIYASGGYIGNFIIGSEAIYSGSHSAYNSNVNGIFLGKNSSDYYIAGGAGAQWWLKSDGTAKIGDLSLEYVNNVLTLTVPAANITGKLAASQLDANDINNSGILRISADKVSFGDNSNVQNELATLNSSIEISTGNNPYIRIGPENGFNIQLSTNAEGGEIAFRQQGTTVAYITNNQLYIEQSVVLTQMDLGERMVDNKGGQWSWKIHENINGQNNLYLKWIG